MSLAVMSLVSHNVLHSFVWNGPGSHVFGLLEYAACIYVEMFLAVMSLVSHIVLHSLCGMALAVMSLVC